MTDDPVALTREGDRLAAAGQPDAAIACFERAVARAPRHVPAWYGLGVARHATGQILAAEDAYRRANAIRAFAPTWNNLGRALEAQGRAAEARAAFEAAIALEPDKANAWDNALLAAQYDPAVADAALLDAHRRWGARLPDRPRPPRRAAGRLRVGLVGADFAAHPVGWFLLGFLGHVRDVDVVVYDGRPRGDAVTAALRGLVAGWTPTAALDDDALAARIAADGVDVLVDLAGHTRGNRLGVFARRPAPVQVTWAGYVGTTGLPAMDALLADDDHAPEDALATERIVRIPGGYVCWAAPDAPAPRRRDGPPTFGCFNNLAKVGPEVRAGFAAVLRAVPDATLLLKTKELADPGLRARVVADIAAHGVDPARIIAEGPSPRDALLARYHDVDVALDPWPYTGGLTTLEALWMGVPVVTRPGRRFASRHALAHLRAVGLDDLAVADLDGWVSTAAALAADRPRLQALRADLRGKLAASPRGDGPGFARRWVEALRTAGDAG